MTTGQVLIGQRTVSDSGSVMVRSGNGSSRRVGYAFSGIHHGELLQGMFTDSRGRPHRGLVTLPCELHAVRAVFTPMSSTAVVVWPPTRTKAARAAREALTALGSPVSGGYLQLTGDVPPSRGFGSSTGDVVATIRAVQHAVFAQLRTSVVAELAVRAETAADPLMYEGRVVLFGQRSGHVLEDFGPTLPPLAVVGFGTSTHGQGVDTLAMRAAEYDDDEIAFFDELRAALRTAIRSQNCSLLGEVATASSEVNQRKLPVARFRDFTALIGETGAVGLQVAHSGDIAGLLFDAGADAACVAERMAAARRLLGRLGVVDVWSFHLGSRA